MKFILAFLFLHISIFSQAQTLTGVISDDLNKPLESANIIAKQLRKSYFTIHYIKTITPINNNKNFKDL